jgi:hypothetical protein
VFLRTPHFVIRMANTVRSFYKSVSTDDTASNIHGI